jgi:hypothetical protein
MSANRWRRALASGGRAALASKGAGGARCKLTSVQLRELETVLDAGPAASGTAPLMLFTTTLLIARNQRILAAWNTRQEENTRRAAAGLPPKPANAAARPSPASPHRHNPHPGHTPLTQPVIPTTTQRQPAQGQIPELKKTSQAHTESRAKPRHHTTADPGRQCQTQT